ncbi:MAG: MBL fold metallo-hydrolase [Caulobacteraceae bacterium]|nr:MBL fold metallo-hydrolase [Caulobacteraceae bacterium]
MTKTVAIAAAARMFAGFGVLWLAVASFAVALAHADAPPKPDPYIPPATGPTPGDGYYETIESVAPGVWTIRQASSFHLQPIGNVTVIDQADGLVLVDGGGSPGSARRIAALIRSVSRKPVKALVVTHWHGDHSLGFGALQQLWPDMRVIATVQTRDRLVTSMDFYAQGAPDQAHTAAFLERIDGFSAFLREAAVNPTISQADRDGYAQAAREFVAYRRDAEGAFIGRVTETFETELALPDARRPILFRRPGRGNTDGDAYAWLPRQRIAVTGDLVIAPVPFGFNAYPRDWAAALRQIAALEPKILVPGHGAVQRDGAYLARLSGLIETSRDRVGRALADRPLSLDEAKAKVDLADQAAAFAGGDPWLAKWFKRYWTDPFVEACWKEATGQPIEQGHG